MRDRGSQGDVREERPVGGVKPRSAAARWRALTVRQPWASMIARGVKRCELRSWAPPESLLDDRLLIHAAMRPMDAEARVLAATALGDADLPLGAIVAACVVEDVAVVEAWPRRDGACRVRDAYTGEPGWRGADPWGRWSPGTAVWRLAEVAPVSPVECSGRQGLWRPGDAALEAVADELAYWWAGP